MRVMIARRRVLLGGLDAVLFDEALFDDFVTFVRGVSLDVDQEALFLVVLQKRLGLGVVDVEAIANACFGVVLSLSERFSSNVVESRLLGRAIASVIDSSTRNVRPTICEWVIEGRAKRSRELIWVLGVSERLAVR